MGHTLTEANYQQAAICEVCGETVGEPLQTDFEKYNFKYVTETDKEYPFTTKCNTSDDLTNGKIIFSDYWTFASDDRHEAKEGYEWKTAKCIEEFECLKEEWIERDDGTAYYETQYKYTVCVPSGFDGIVLSVFDYESKHKIDEVGGEVNSLEDVMLYMEDEDTVSFRLR